MSTRSRQPSDPPTTAGRKFQQKDIPIILNEISEKMDHFNKQSKAQTNIMNSTRESGNSMSRTVLLKWPPVVRHPSYVPVGAITLRVGLRKMGPPVNKPV